MNVDRICLGLLATVVGSNLPSDGVLKTSTSLVTIAFGVSLIIWGLVSGYDNET